MAKAPKNEAPVSDADVIDLPGEEGSKRKREKVTTTRYFSGGQPTKDPRVADEVLIEVVGGEEVRVRPADFPEEIRNALEIGGTAIILKNAAGGLRGYDAFNSMMDRIENWQQGVWSAAGGGGPRVGMLAQAIVNLGLDKGRGLDAVKRVLAESEEKRKAFAANSRIAAEVERLKLEEQQERARKAAERAGNGGGEDDLPDLD